MLRQQRRVGLYFLVVFFFIVLAAGTATAQDSDEGFIGISTGLDLAYFSPSAAFDDDGESEDFPDGYTDTVILANINVEYMTTFLSGAYIGLDIPIVSRTIEMGDIELSGTGTGDTAGTRTPAGTRQPEHH